MRPVDVTFTMSWSIHDSWTETLAGTHYLLSLFSASHSIGDKAHLCRLVLISANHLIEKLFFDLCSEVLSKDKELYTNIRAEFDRKSLYTAMNEWPQKLVPGSLPFDFNVEPFLSADELRKQRNKSIHKESESVSLEMAKKAMYTSVETCKCIWNYFKPTQKFKYEEFLNKYPVENVGHYITADNINVRL